MSHPNPIPLDPRSRIDSSAPASTRWLPRPVEYAGYLLGLHFGGDPNHPAGPGLGGAGSHPQFLHLHAPPSGYRFTSGTRSIDPERVRWMEQAVTSLEPGKSPAATGDAQLDRMGADLAQMSAAAMGYGASVNSIRAYLQLVPHALQTTIPPDAQALFMPTLPWCLGAAPWLVEIEDSTTLFFPEVINGMTYDVQPATLGSFPIVKALLEGPNCRAILTHIQSTADSLATLFRSDRIGEKVVCAPLGLPRLPELRPDSTPGSRETVTFLFTNSWHQNATGFSVRGGVEVLAAFPQVARRHPEARLVIRSKLPDLPEHDLRLLRGHPQIRVISEFLSDGDLDALFRSADVYLIPAARIHVTSVLKPMSYGIPVIATDGWAFNEYLRDGDTGFLVPGRYGQSSWMDAKTGMMREDYRSLHTLRDPNRRVVAGLVDRMEYLLAHREAIAQTGARARQALEREFTLDRWNEGVRRALDRLFTASASPVTAASESASKHVEATGSLVTASDTAMQPSESTATAAHAPNQKRPSILLIPFECADWRNARAWSYNGGLAFEEGLRACGAEVLTLPAIAGIPCQHDASLLRYAKELCAGRRFDQAWVWVTHNDYTPEFFEWLGEIAPVRAGVVMESMEHTAEEYAQYTTLPGRRDRVCAQLKHLTHVLTFDDLDAEGFARDLGLPALWCPPVVPARTVAASVLLPDPGPAVFYGTLYSPERRAFLNSPLLKKHLSRPPLPEEQTDLPTQFDRVQARFINRLAAEKSVTHETLERYLDSLRDLRRRLYDLWLAGLRAGYASVNLPSIFKGYAGRVVESMAVGRPVVSWDPPRPRTRALFTPDKEILLFPKHDPAGLASQIRKLRKDPAAAHALADAARRKVLAFHTAETRVDQVLKWIASGALPEYGENRAAPAAEMRPSSSLKEIASAHEAAATGLNRTKSNGSVAAGSRVPTPSAVPTPAARPVIGLGDLNSSREYLRSKQLGSAWTAGAEAVTVRPFHPEGFVLLAEIAREAGDLERARQCAQRAHELAPTWRTARKLFKQLPAPAQGTPPHPATREWPALPEFTAAPRLTVCVIARNEEKFLPQCLRSVRDIAWQLVVLDTGSTDATVERARELGAEVHHFTWCDDFAAAKNAALERARGDWVLFLDADEELSAEGRTTLPPELQDAQLMALRLPILNEGCDELGQTYVPRLFRNAPGIHFLGRVHEHPFHSVDVLRKSWGLDNRMGRSVIRHHGYTKELVVERNKAERNLHLLELAVREYPGEPNLWLNHGLELARAGRSAEGLASYREALRLTEALPPAGVLPEFRECLLSRYAMAMLSEKRYTEVTDLLRTPLAKSAPLNPTVHYAAGIAFFHLDQFEASIEQLRLCLERRTRPVCFPILSLVASASPSNALGLACAQAKRFAEAEAAFRSALEQNPDDRSAGFNLARALWAQEKPIPALESLHALVTAQATHRDAWILGAQIALSRPEFLEFAFDWTGEALKALPADQDIAAQRAEVLLLRGELAEALPLWRSVAREDRPERTAAIILCELCAGELGDHQLNGGSTAVNGEFLRWYQRLLQANANGPVLRVNEQLGRLHDVLPTAARAIEAAVSEAAA